MDLKLPAAEIRHVRLVLFLFGFEIAFRPPEQTKRKEQREADREVMAPQTGLARNQFTATEEAASNRGGARKEKPIRYCSALLVS